MAADRDETWPPAPAPKTTAPAPTPVASSTDDPRWHAVMARESSAEDAFVYAVRTTGIYCRPTCASRRPRRENVVFFDEWVTAEKAGYRSCKRCRPHLPEPDTVPAVVAQACERIRTAEREPDLATLAGEACYSPTHFQRLFKAAVGLSPKQYAIALRSTRLRDRLLDANSVTDAIYDAGFSTASRAYDHADTGMPLSTYLDGARDQTIRHCRADSSLGPVVIAATEQGICMMEFGDPEQLVAELQRRFPKATVTPAEDALQGLVEQVLVLIDEPSRAVELPLDIRGTAFQRRVWTALRDLPAGETVSYEQLARRLGKPGAARAVAGACAANTLAVAVPCHRVVNAAGELAGYRWGIERKQTLLDREATGMRAPRIRPTARTAAESTERSA
jgi:AraC family transcriptional regulator, regulatory protein of adaptative response / methylated-DNA-[protein]-cysteine methyltransferase